MKRVTLDDVASLVNVSPITVSRALRRPEAVSAPLRARIQAAVKKLGYVPNIAASRLASGRTHLAGVVVPTLYNVIFAEYLLALHEVLNPAGFQISVLNSHYSEIDEEAAVRALIGQRVEGIVVAGVEHTRLTRRLLAKSRIPVIETLELAEEPLGLNIGLSQEDAAGAAVSHLIETGRRRIAFFAGELDNRALARLDGFRRAMAAAGLEAEATVTQISQSSSIHLGSTLFAKHLEEGGPAEGIFCIDDNLALGAMQACRKSGLQVPQDVAIVGFHDLEFAACLSPSLSSVKTRRYETGRLAAERLVEALKGGKTFARERIDLGFTLAPRESTVSN